MPDDPLKSYSWWVGDLRRATNRRLVMRYGKWLLQCEMSAEEGEEGLRLIHEKLTFPRSRTEKDLICKWEHKVGELKKGSQPAKK